MYKDIAKVESIFSSVYYTTLVTLKPKFKHRGFSSEKEYRIYLEEGEAESTATYMKKMLPIEPGEDIELFETISKNILRLSKKLSICGKDKKYGLFGDNIRSYYNLDFSEIWSDVFIQEIVLGPKCFQNKNELKGFLKSTDQIEQK